jgi:4-aminobutyrate aminotransferase-like enzyme/Ser/Thr protein kinase RdoA (MazF antagonist)
VRTTGQRAGRNEPAGRVQLDPTSVALLLQQHYGLTVIAQHELGGETDHNIKITAADGASYALKVSAGSPEHPTIRWQMEVLRHLAVSVPEVGVPRLVPSLSGAELVEVGTADAPAVARLLQWLDGTMLVALDQHPAALLRDLGRAAAQLTSALSGIEAPTDLPSHDWDIRKAPAVIAAGLPFVRDPVNRAQVERILSWFPGAASFVDLPHGVVHHDINDFNVLVSDSPAGPVISGVLDLADAIETVRVAEVAIAVAYAMLRKDDVLQAACDVVAGFDSVLPLTDAELLVIFPLAAARLCLNAVTWTRRIAEEGTTYGAQRMAHTWPAVERIVAIEPPIAEAALRASCGRSPSPAAEELTDWLAQHATEFSTVVGDAAVQQTGPITELRLDPDSDLYDDLVWQDIATLRTQARAHLEQMSLPAFTRHLSPSLLNGGRRRIGQASPATYQLGVGLLLSPGAPVCSPAAGVVQSAPTGVLALRHSRPGTGGTGSYWTVWHGLVDAPPEGSSVVAGGTIGRPAGGTLPDAAVQVQVFVDEELALGTPPRWLRAEERWLWRHVAPDPGPLLGLPDRSERASEAETVLANRDRHLASSQRVYYRRPPKLSRGRGVWLYDEHGLAYLDSINNVSHVGHAEPRIADAARRQLLRLNTNSRFLYDSMASYAERLTATLPAGLDVVFLVCTGSEANDLALRIARHVTGRKDVMVIDGAYHGNTAAVTGISPNRYKGRGGGGPPPTTHEVLTPDRYRGPYGYDDPEAGRKYGQDVAGVAQRLVREGRAPAAFIAESLLGTAGCIELPAGYLASAFSAVRSLGGLCISDEVQVGVGRLGTAFWGFELQGVTPDIVTMGKPLGNGHPLAAVVTTREIANAFDNGAKYFNTFGGNPVSCVVGETVLSIVEQDGLQQRAHEVGRYFRDQLLDLAKGQPSIGDVRARGLYLGIDLVSDPQLRTPDAELAYAVAETMKDDGVITYPTGTADNVLKIKPPMVFSPTHVDLYVETLNRALDQHRAGGS